MEDSDDKRPLSSIMVHTLTLYFPMFPFDPPENIRKPKVFLCFQGNQKGTLGSKGLRIYNCHILEK